MSIFGPTWTLLRQTDEPYAEATGWRFDYLGRLRRILEACAEQKIELPDATLKDCQDFLGVLVGR